MSFFQELKRRNVVRVGIAYIVASWLLLQLTEVLTELLEVSADIGKIVVILLIVGFVPALIFAWAFELTPEGIKRENEVDRSQSIVGSTGRKLDYFIIAVLVIALGYFIYDEYQDRLTEAASIAAVQSGADAAAGLDPAPPVPVEPSIAVLPFADMSAEGNQAYFSDGISEELLNLLVRVEGLKVASRTSSFAFKNSGVSIADIASELKVDHVLEGSVRKADNRVRITAQLIDAETDRHLWSATYDRELDDIFAIQDDIANAIVAALQAELGVLPEGISVSVEAATENLDAYELYLEGRGLFIARVDLERSIALLEQAVALDPTFARAWEALAAVYSVAISWNIVDRNYDELAVEAADRALQLEPELSMAWAVKGVSSMDLNLEYVRAMEHLDKAVELDPKNATAYLWRGIIWATLKFIDKGIQDIETCLVIDPQYGNCTRHLGRLHILKGDMDRGLALYQEGAEAGFFGSDAAFVAALMARGDRLAAALALWTWKQDRSYPAKLILDAYQYPERDHSRSLDRFLAWARTQDREVSFYQEELLVLGGYEYVEQARWANYWIWQQMHQGFRDSAYFKPMVRNLGVLDYWRSQGFPPGCRPSGDEDFECD